jgi:LUD domain
VSLPGGPKGAMAQDDALASLRRLRGRVRTRARAGLLDEAIGTLTDLGFDVAKLAGPDDVVSKVLEIVPAGATAAYQPCVVGRAIALDEALRREGRTVLAVPADGNPLTQNGDWRGRLLGAQFGITGANALVADTGTLVLVEDSGFGRATSNIPPGHIALVTADSVVEDLLDAAVVARGYAVLHLNRTGSPPRVLPRYVSLISGPSKTADIGHTLVRGMHGPRTVHVLIWDRPKAAGTDDDALRSWVLA